MIFFAQLLSAIHGVALLTLGSPEGHIYIVASYVIMALHGLKK